MRTILNKRNGHALPGSQYLDCRRLALVRAGHGFALAVPPPELWAGALSLLLIHGESGCPHSALNAARILDRLCDATDLDDATRALCERASNRLSEAKGVAATPQFRSQES
jgi:hypothetical protein